MHQILALLIIHTLSANIILAQDTIYLQNDSLIKTTTTKIWFEGDTTVIINRRGEAIEGNIKNNSYLWTGRRLLYFKKNNRIKLNEDGNVTEGVLVKKTPLWTAKNYYQFNNNVRVKFTSDGYLLEGQLSRNQTITLRGKKIVFQRAKPIAFTQDGKIKEGFIAKREQLKNSLGKSKAYKAGSHLIFNENEEVFEKPKLKRGRKNKNPQTTSPPPSE